MSVSFTLILYKSGSALYVPLCTTFRREWLK